MLIWLRESGPSAHFRRQTVHFRSKGDEITFSVRTRVRTRTRAHTRAHAQLLIRAACSASSFVSAAKAAGRTQLRQIPG